MVYRAIGLMSGSSLDGLDIAFVEFQEQGSLWTYEIIQAKCYPYTEEWTQRLLSATSLSAREYQLLHADFGHYLGTQVNQFIKEQQLFFQVALVASHGHTTFHMPLNRMTAQLGDGAAIAAVTQLPVITDLRAMDIAFGGQGAPIVPIGEKLLLSGYDLFLNLGGIANISYNNPGGYIAFDVCPANRVLNLLSNYLGKPYDDEGRAATTGKVNIALLEKLNGLDYYKQPYPKSLANDFGTNWVYPIIREAAIDIHDGLRTFVEHIAFQVKNAIAMMNRIPEPEEKSQLLVTGGGAMNIFLVQRIRELLNDGNISVIVPEEKLVNFKEALIMAFMGVLRWRQEYNVLSSVTGAARDSIGGALWIGQEA
jgi:anhydro-N-acetylmuramic acid kinase